MLYMVVFLCIITMLISISIGLVLFKGYTLLKDYKKEEDNLAYFNTKIKELEERIIPPVQDTPPTNPITHSAINDNHSTPKQKYHPITPKIISDNKVYTQEEFLREMGNGNFQMGSTLRSRLNEKK